VLPGGGVPLLRAIKALDGIKVENSDQQTGIEIVRKAIQMPARQIIDNSGADGVVIVGKLIENPSYSYGYNAQTDEYGDLIKLGIVDPTKVVAHRAPGRRIGRGFDRHHRGDDHRAPEEGNSGISAWRDGGNGLLKNPVCSVNSSVLITPTPIPLARAMVERLGWRDAQKKRWSKFDSEDYERGCRPELPDRLAASAGGRTDRRRHRVSISTARGK
jgi:TCP-1/cpn60 chaperonin family